MSKSEVLVRVYSLTTLDGPETEEGSIKWAVRRFIADEVGEKRSGAINMQVLPLIVPPSSVQLAGNKPLMVMLLVIWTTILA